MLAWEAHSTLSQSSLCSFHGLRIQDDISYHLSPMRLSEKTKRVTLGYPFCLTAEGFGQPGLRFTLQPAVLPPSPALISPPTNGNGASRPKPLSGLFVIGKVYLLCETKNKQAVCWKIVSALSTCLCFSSFQLPGVSLVNPPADGLQGVLCFEMACVSLGL